MSDSCRRPRRRRSGNAALAAVLALPLLLAARCGPGDRHGAALRADAGRAAAAARAAAAPATPPPWLPVHPERQARLAGIPVYQVGFPGTPPRKLVSPPPRLAPSSPFRRFGGVMIADCLIDLEGYVVAVQVLKTPDPADQQALARAMAGWRFAPARLAGQPAAVHFTVSIPVARDPCPPTPPAGRCPPAGRRATGSGRSPPSSRGGPGARRPRRWRQRCRRRGRGAGHPGRRGWSRRRRRSSG
jgi:hypothetical protein